MVLSMEPAEGTEAPTRGPGAIAEMLSAAERSLTAITGDEARIEAELLFADVLEIDRTHLLARLTDHPVAHDVTTFESLLQRRLAREPLSYIVGHCEFYAIEIACSPAALIPRWESEMLVEFALEHARRHDGPIRIADVGTGAGAIAIAFAANAPNAVVTATERSAEALLLARENAQRTGVADRVTLVETDLLDGLDEFDVIVANLPYLSEEEWAACEPEVRDHEPRSALVGGPIGIEIIERLLESAPAHVRRGGALALELGADQAAAATRIARAHFLESSIDIVKDLAGHDRVLEVRT
jgi:release factor glutamine methyltransferase